MTVADRSAPWRMARTWHAPGCLALGRFALTGPPTSQAVACADREGVVRRRRVPRSGALASRLGCNGVERREPRVSVEASEMVTVPRAELDALKAELRRLRREVGRNIARARIGGRRPWRQRAHPFPQSARGGLGNQ